MSDLVTSRSRSRRAQRRQQEIGEAFTDVFGGDGGFAERSFKALRILTEPFSRMEALVARPITAVQETGDIEDAYKSFIETLTSSKLTPIRSTQGFQIGDVLRNIGVPEAAAATGGLALSFPVVGAPFKAAGAMRNLARGQQSLSKAQRLTARFIQGEIRNPTQAEGEIIKKVMKDLYKKSNYRAETFKKEMLEAMKNPNNRRFRGLTPEDIKVHTLDSAHLMDDTFEAVKSVVTTADDLTPAQARLLDLPRIAELLDGGKTGGAFSRFIVKPLQEADIAMSKKMRGMERVFNKVLKKNDVGMDLFGKKSHAMSRFIESGNKAEFLPRGMSLEKATNISKFMRRQYDQARQSLNKVRIANGQTPIAYRENYLSHIREMTLLEQLGHDITKIPLDEMQNALFAKGVPFSFAKQRQTLLKETERMGAFQAFEQYMRKAFNVQTHTQIIPRLEAMKYAAKKTGKKNLQDYINLLKLDLTGARVERGPIEALLTGTPTGRMLFQLQKRFISNVIVGNPSVAINQALGLSPIVGLAGGMNTLKGTALTFGGELKRMMLTILGNKDALSFAHKHSRVLQARMATSIPELTGVFGTKGTRNFFGRGRVNRWLTAPLEYTDQFMVATGFNTGYRMAIKSGASVSDAIKLGDKVAEATQATYIRFLRPQILRSSQGQFFAPLQTFVLNNFNLLRKDIPSLGKLDAAEAYGRIAASSIMLHWAIDEHVAPSTGDPLTNFVQDTLPFSGISRFGLPGVLGMATRMAKGLGGDPSVNIKRELARDAFLLGPKQAGGLYRKI
ncbi:MAG: hypothetical protein NWE76_08880, partial [Candidatus Bathyarchaeota archaeon]|nr:hypothetical protein [Candidatus Bathyarchaeota archaeon]